jgi:ParB-like chromosome segregation protein Spo0J
MRVEQKYKQISASLTHVGLVEPIVVFSAGRGKYLVLDARRPDWLNVLLQKPKK